MKLFKIVRKQIIYKKAKANNKIVPMGKKHNKLFIIGGGPSASVVMNEQSLKQLSKEYDLMMANDNLFLFFDLAKECSLNYWIAMDPLYYVKDAYGYVDVDREQAIIDTNRREINKIYETCDWDMCHIMPKRFENSYKKDNKFIKKYCVASEIIPSFLKRDERRFELYDKNLFQPGCETVMHTALTFGVSNYDEVGFIGCEYNYWKDTWVEKDGKIRCGYSHSFDEDNPVLFVTEYEKYHRFGGVMSNFLKYLSNAYSIFWDINEFAKSKNVRLINYSDETFIESIEQGQINELLDTL